MALASSCQNPLLQWIYRLINDIRAHNQWNARKNHILTADRIRYYNQHHRQLLDAIRQRDQPLAAEIICSHLQQARKDLMG
jgi:DNA-binding GntR family transcriptional regulator